MISISKPKLLSLVIILLIGSASFYLGQVLASPAPSRSSIITPGSMTEPASYIVYTDGATTLIRNGATGDNDFSATQTADALQSLFTFLSTVSIGSQPIGGFPADNTQFSIMFEDGNYYFSHVVTINLPQSPSGGIGISMFGQGDNRVTLALNNGVNNDIFNITSSGDIFQMWNMKVSGNKVNQSGTSNCVEVNSAEIAFFHVELRDCLTDAIRINTIVGGSNGWNVFQDTWILNCGSAGINVNTGVRTDFRFTGDKFESCNPGIKFSQGNSADISIAGSNFNNAGIQFLTGSTKQVTIASNVFWSAPTKTIDFEGTGLGAGNTIFNALVSANSFQTNTGTNVAIYLNNHVDGVTVTSNQFSGYTSSSTVPVTLIQTTQKATTLVTQNSGMGSFWTGFGIAQPAVPASTVNQANNNPYQVRIYITGTGTGITAYKLTDPSATTNTFTVAVGVGFAIDVDPYAQIALTYTGTPTWVWYGLANLT